MQTEISASEAPLVLTTSMYDLLKEQIRKKRLSRFNEERITLELKTAKQVLRKEIPENVVTVNKAVTVLDETSGEEFTYKLVAPDKAKRKNQTHSILSPIGVAMLGYAQGAQINWEMPLGMKSFRIKEVKNL